MMNYQYEVNQYEPNVDLLRSCSRVCYYELDKLVSGILAHEQDDVVSVYRLERDGGLRVKKALECNGEDCKTVDGSEYETVEHYEKKDAPYSMFVTADGKLLIPLRR